MDEEIFSLPVASEDDVDEDKIRENKKNLRKKKLKVNDYDNESENLLDFDKILEEIYENNFSDEEVSNLPLSITTKNWKKINKSIKGNLLN